MARELTPLTYDEADEIVHRLVGNDALSAEMAARLLLAVRDGDAPSAAGASETGPSGVDSALEIRLRDDAERLRSALRVHGAHSSSCDILMLLTSDPPLRKPCSCGLAAALAVPAPIAVRADIVRLVDRSTFDPKPELDAHSAAGASETETVNKIIREIEAYTLSGAAKEVAALSTLQFAILLALRVGREQVAVRAESAPVAHAHQWVAGPAPTTGGQRQGFVCSACGLLKSEEV